MDRRIILVSLVVVILTCTAPLCGAFYGDEVVLGGGNEFRYALELEPGEKIQRGIAVQSDEPNALVSLSVQFLGARGDVVEFISTGAA